MAKQLLKTSRRLLNSSPKNSNPSSRIGSDQRGFAYPCDAVMAFASPQMIKNYQKYGDMVSFDITYNLLKNSSTEEKV
jgi:hypothetical protein